MLHWKFVFLFKALLEETRLLKFHRLGFVGNLER